MPTLNTQTHDQLVAGQAVAIQASSRSLVDFSVGSILRALSEAVTGVALWLQGLILVLLASTRAATATASDLDTWVADFGAAPTAVDPTLIARLPATSSTGALTFSRKSTTGAANVPVGSTVGTQDGSQSFKVTVDTTNPAYSSTLNAYVLAAGVGSITVAAASVNTGAATNAAIGAVNTLTSAIPGVDAVNNAAAFVGGADPETDAAFRIRFRQFVAALRLATPKAVQAAIQGLQRGVTCTVVENLDYSGGAHPGFFYALVDDGTGNPPTSLLTAASAAADATRAAGIAFAVFAPTVVPINVTATLVTAAGANHASDIATAQTALTAYLNTLPIGATVYISRIWQVLQDSSGDVVEVTGLSVNSGSADITMTRNQVAKAGTLTIS